MTKLGRLAEISGQEALQQPVQHTTGELSTGMVTWRRGHINNSSCAAELAGRRASRQEALQHVVRHNNKEVASGQVDILDGYQDVTEKLQV